MKDPIASLSFSSIFWSFQFTHSIYKFYKYEIKVARQTPESKNMQFKLLLLVKGVMNYLP